MVHDRHQLAELRVMIVEDTLLLAEAMKMMLEDCGCTVVGPAARLSSGMRLAGTSEVDGAILDVNLAGEMCFPIARLLADRGIPFIFITGYDDTSAVPPEFRGRPRLSKPVEDARLLDTVARHFTKAPHDG
jgi:two-component SAPR family response regulator